MKSIFKYFSINAYSLDALKNCYVFCNHYETFNDPFECWCIVNKGIPDPEKDKERFLNVIKVWGFTPNMAEDAKQHYDDYLCHFEDDQIDVEYQINSAKISCFSNDSTNLLMWAHYANGLRGYCIEFAHDELLNTKEKNPEIIEVAYLDTPPILETICYPLANDIFWHGEDEDSDGAVDFMRDFYSKMLASKPREWKYEKEVRLIFHSLNNKLGERLHFHKSAIQSIIIGERMSIEDRKMLFDVIKSVDFNIPIKLAKRSRHSYNVILHNLDF